MFRGKSVVIKYGGAAMQSTALQSGVMEDVAAIAATGAHVIVVHGGGPELSALQAKLGSEPRFVEGLRYTDEATIEAALMTLCGKINKNLVRLIENAGGRAAGISGIDGGILKCVRKKEPDLGYVGEITEVDTELLQALLDADYIPVVSTVGLGTDGNAYNINADTAAGMIAVNLPAEFFVAMSDIPGVLSDPDDPDSLIAGVRLDEVEKMIAEGVISGGMIPKARGIAEAVRGGVGTAFIIDGRVPRALRNFIEGECVGTTFTG